MDRVKINPFEYFNYAPHIVDLIIQHFKVKELVKTTEVSPEFNNIISSSRKWKEKIKFHGSKYKGELKRQYWNVKFLWSNSAKNFERLSLTLDDVRKMFAEQTSIRCFETEEEGMVNVFLTKDQAKNLTELKLHGGRLNISGYCDKAFILRGCGSLSNLRDIETIHLVCQGSVRKEFAELLANSLEHLRELVVKKCDKKLTRVVFQSISRNKRIQLEKFIFHDHSFYNFSGDKHSLLKLMESQSNSIKFAEFDVWATLHVIKQLLRMPALKTLRLFELSKSDGTSWESINLPVSTSITKLLLDDLKDNKDLLIAFLKACPSIKSLKIHSRTTEIMAVIQEYGRNINQVMEI